MEIRKPYLMVIVMMAVVFAFTFQTIGTVGSQNSPNTITAVQESITVSTTDTNRTIIEKVLDNIKVSIVEIDVLLDPDKAILVGNDIHFNDGELAMLVTNVRNGGIATVTLQFQTELMTETFTVLVQ